MTGIELGNILLYAGAGVMALAALGLVAALLGFRARRKKLDKELELEYGKNTKRGGK